MVSPIPDGDAVVGRGGFIAHSLKSTVMHRGRADLVLAAVPLADGAGVVKVHHKVLLQLVIDLFGLAGELLEQGQHGGFIGSQGGMQVQNCAHIVGAPSCPGPPPLHHKRQWEGQGDPVGAQEGSTT